MTLSADDRSGRLHALRSGPCSVLVPSGHSAPAGTWVVDVLSPSLYSFTYHKFVRSSEKWFLEISCSGDLWLVLCDAGLTPVPDTAGPRVRARRSARMMAIHWRPMHWYNTQQGSVQCMPEEGT